MSNRSMPTAETPTTIRAWATATFGRRGSTLTRLLRGSREATELADALMLAETRLREMFGTFSPSYSDLDSEQRDHIAEEAADVAIILLDTAEAAGIAIPEHHGISLKYPGVSALDDALSLQGDFVSALDRARRQYLAPSDPTWFLQARTLCVMMARLEAICVAMNCQLADAIDFKMQINRLRSWVVDDNGNGSHMKGVGRPPRFSIVAARLHGEEVRKAESERQAAARRLETVFRDPFPTQERRIARTAFRSFNGFSVSS